MLDVRELYGNGREALSPGWRWIVLGGATPRDVKRTLATLGADDVPWCGLARDGPLLLVI